MRFLILAFAMLVVAACSDYTDDLSGDYYFASEANDQQVIARDGMLDGEPYIPCNVEAYDDDGRFIIARQRVTEFCFWGGAKPAPTSVGQVLYWIVDTENDDFLGPYRDPHEFDRERQARGVVAKLS